MSLITLPTDDDCGDWLAQARIQVEEDGSVSMVLVREWRTDGVEPDDLSEQAEQPQPYRH
jgi:phenylalanyl-tRNA synthetase beta subunit